MKKTDKITIRRRARTLEIRARMAELAGDHKVAKTQLEIARKLRKQLC